MATTKNGSVIFDDYLMFYMDMANADSYTSPNSKIFDLTPNNKDVNKNSVTYNPSKLGSLTFNQTAYCSFVDSAPFNGVTYYGKTLILVGKLASDFNSGIFSAPNYGFRQVFGAANAPTAAYRNWYFAFYHDGTSSGYRLHQSTGGYGTLSQPIPFSKLSPGGWFFAAFTHSTDGNYRYYFNGEYAGKEYGESHTIPFFQPLTLTSTELIGGGTDQYGGPFASFRGEVAVAMVYRRDLTEDEIKQNYRVFASRYNI
jgi:hypothetical protein